MNRNALYLVIGVLAVGSIFLGYRFYQERQKVHGIEINVDKNRISIESK
jgi:hypothetical protein